MPKVLYVGAALDAQISKSGSNSNDSVEGKRDNGLLLSASLKTGPNGNVVQDNAKPAWEIFNPQTFLKMSEVRKRATLRASGVKELPRPREGKAALDKVLFDLMDDAVRGEVRRLDVSSSISTNEYTPAGGDVSGSGSSSSLNKVPARALGGVVSKRQEVLRLMISALGEDNIEKAEEFRERFAILTAIKADPTQAEGSYQQFLDQDEWYMQERRKAMGITSIKKKSESDEKKL